MRRALAPHPGFVSGRRQGKIILSLASMSDEEMDRICQTCGKLDPAPFFFGQPWPMLRESTRWLPLILRDWWLIRRMMAGG